MVQQEKNKEYLSKRVFICGQINRFEIDNKIYGEIYKNKIIHLAEYIPYKIPPSKMLCGIEFISFAGNAERNLDNICKECEKKIIEIYNRRNKK